MFLTGCNSGGTEANLAAIDIPLPYQEGYVQDMKITDDANLSKPAKAKSRRQKNHRKKKTKRDSVADKQ